MITPSHRLLCNMRTCSLSGCWKRLLLCALGLALVIPAMAGDRGAVLLKDVAEHAVQQSKLTNSGGPSFHLRAEIVETTNSDSSYRAKVEEYWISATKWRRSIDSPGFSQLVVVNGDKLLEQDTGDYFPWWLQDLTTAMVDPLPLFDIIKNSTASLPKPLGGPSSQTCADMRTSVDRWIFCFEGSHGLLTSVHARGYDADFKEFKSFGTRQVARRILIDPEPGTTIQATISELTELRDASDTLFEVPQATPLRDQIRSVKLRRSHHQELVF